MASKRLKLNLLIGLNSFILFFILVEPLVEIPAYLQVFGRLHPLLLHFPIVLLFLCWILVFFRKRIENGIPSLSTLVEGLIFISALLCAVTVIMGLLLSKEGGYEGSSFNWHKWSGVVLSFLISILFFLARHTQGIRQERFTTIGINLSLIVLLIVGHFGANLTHGENFVLAPITSEPPKTLNLETATVFHDAVLPILETKCMSCHNPDKAKGELILLDSASLNKGGKTGPLFLSGSPMESLLMERLLLDINHKHRMPPKGKPQLTQEEIDLFQAWIASGLPFNAPLRSSGDTLLQAAKMVYPVQQESETYAFAMADPQTITSLGTPYRIISPIANASPALSVNFYGREAFDTGSLSELAPIAQQIVFLNLSNMPLKQNDLLILKEFVNLRELNLNYTNLKDADLSSLVNLVRLKHVSLSGTSITAEGLKQLLASKSLKNAYVWNTPIQETELGKLRKQFPLKHIDTGAKLDESVFLPLTEPRIKPARSFFRNKITVSFSHPIDGVEIRYTLDGSDPDSTTALVYTKEIHIEKNLTLRAKAFKKGWLASKEIKQSYTNSPIKPDSVSLANKPHHLYRGKQAQALFDLESGGVNHVDGKWIGFRGTAFIAQLFFDQPIRINTLNLSVKQLYNEHNVFMYPPEFIEIWGGKDSSSMRLLAKQSPPLSKPGEVQGRRLLTSPIHTDNLRYLKIKAIPYLKIPTGFPAEGRQAWLFVDEIIVN